jgi:hypothetical protein
MTSMETATHNRIDKLEVTRDTLTGRGGLAFFVKYVEAIGIVALLLNKFTGLKKSAKGVSLGNLFLQALYFFFDGSSRHLCYFDDLQREEGYAAVVEMPRRQMASLHAMKRFFGSLPYVSCRRLPLGAAAVVPVALAAAETASADIDPRYHGPG